MHRKLTDPAAAWQPGHPDRFLNGWSGNEPSHCIYLGPSSAQGCDQDGAQSKVTAFSPFPVGHWFPNFGHWLMTVGR